MYEITNKQLFSFIEKGKSPFHVVENIKHILLERGFISLREQDLWNLEAGRGYFVTRNGSSILAFYIPKADFEGFQIIASHSDSPTFRIKDHGELTVENSYVKLNVEKYGGMLLAPWFDRPLSIAGRVMVKRGDFIQQKLIDFDRDLVLIPNLAIHMNREVNTGHEYKIQSELLPLLGQGSKGLSLKAMIANELGVKENDILSQELSLYLRQKASIWGANREFISSTKLDDLQCAFSSIKAFLAGRNANFVTMCAIFDNEEVGSGTKQGAASTFLKDTLKRINACFFGGIQEYQMRIAKSFLLSADNGHAVHPNYQAKADPSNRPLLNGGVLIKHSANQKYTTDAFSAGIVRMICQKAGVPYQDYFNHSDVLGGSTLGNISSQQVPIHSADIGVAQLAMHSPYETGGAKDTFYLEKFMETFYQMNFLF